MDKNTFKKAFVTVAVSQIIACLCGFLANTIDSVVTGQFLGGDCVAAIGYCTPVIFLYVAISSLISSGTQLKCSNYIGKGDMKKANGQYSLGLLMMAVTGLVIIGIIHTFPIGLARLLGATGDTMIDLTSKYLRSISFGILPIYTMQFFVSICNIDGNSILPVISVFVLIIADTAFDLLNAIVFKGGIYGMGLASSLAYVISAMVIASHIFTKKYSFKFSLGCIENGMLTDAIKGGLPSSIQNVGLSLVTLVINHLLGGDNSASLVAAFSIAFCITEMLKSIPNGLTPSVLTFSGVFYGEQDKESLKNLQTEMVKASLIWNAIALAIFCALTKFMVLAFTDEIDIVNIAVIATPLVIDYFGPKAPVLTIR